MERITVSLSQRRSPRLLRVELVAEVPLLYKKYDDSTTFVWADEGYLNYFWRTLSEGRGLGGRGGYTDRTQRQRGRGRGQRGSKDFSFLPVISYDDPRIRFQHRFFIIPNSLVSLLGRDWLFWGGY